MALHQNSLLAPADKDLVKGCRPVVENMVVHQDSLQAVVQVNPLAMDKAHQGQASHTARGEGLAQGSLLAPNSMALAQERLLALVTTHLSKVNLPMVGNMVLSLDNQLVAVSMGLALVIPQAVVSTRLAQVSLPA